MPPNDAVRDERAGDEREEAFPWKAPVNCSAAHNPFEMLPGHIFDAYY